MSLPSDDTADRWIRIPGGVVPYEYLERIAICMIDGGLSEQEATQLATLEHQRQGTGGYVPNC